MYPQSRDTRIDLIGCVKSNHLKWTKNSLKIPHCILIKIEIIFYFCPIILKFHAIYIFFSFLFLVG